MSDNHLKVISCLLSFYGPHMTPVSSLRCRLWVPLGKVRHHLQGPKPQSRSCVSFDRQSQEPEPWNSKAKP